MLPSMKPFGLRKSRQLHRVTGLVNAALRARVRSFWRVLGPCHRAVDDPRFIPTHPGSLQRLTRPWQSAMVAESSSRHSRHTTRHLA